MVERVSSAVASPVELAMLIAALDRLSETIDLVRSELIPGRDGRSIQQEPSQPRDDTGITATLRPAGEYWTIGREQTFLLRDSLGLRYLARLVAEPGREFHVLDMAAFAGSAQAGGDRDRGEGSARSDDVLVDATARAAYRTRLLELKAEREGLLSADTALADGRLAEIDEEVDALRVELTRAYGLGGRARRWASEAERARQRVGKAIRTAIERIQTNDERLGSHLRHCLRTGMYCSYDPEPGSLVRWELAGADAAIERFGRTGSV